MALTQDRIRDYRANGYLTGLPAADPVVAAEYRELFDQLEGDEGREKTRIGLIDRHFDRSFIYRIATLPAVLDAVSELIGPNVMLLATHFFCKYGREERFVAWHQDVTYWDLEPPNAITAWYAVDDSDRENGCMRVIPGTHLGGLRHHGTAAGGGNLLSANQEAPVSPDEECGMVDLELRAGQYSLHDGALVHGSRPNLSDRRRCGLTARYVTPDIRPIGKSAAEGRWKAICVRGDDAYGHFGRVPAPFPSG